MSRQSYEPVRFELTPGRTALLLIDLQNDFLDPAGHYAQSGVDIEHMRRVLGPTGELVAAARAREIPIVWTRHGFRDLRDAGIFARLRPFLRDGGLRQGTWGYELYEGLDVRPEDWFVGKSRLSAFFDTGLEVVLRGLRAETLLIGGVLTNQCVAATSKDAMFRDLGAVVIPECTGTTLPHLHEPALEMMRVGWAEVRPLAELLADLERLPATAVT
jgi:ureidoacrylate peracid hydrolase